MSEVRELEHVEWLYGESGTGKSFRVRNMHGMDCYVWNTYSQFQKYNNEPVILFEEIDDACNSGKLTARDIVLRYATKNPRHVVHRKHKESIPLNASHIFFISSNHPKQLLDMSDHQIETLFDELVTVTHCTHQNWLQHPLNPINEINAKKNGNIVE